MPERPVAGIDVSKDFSDMCILSPTNTVFRTAHVYHDPVSMSRAAAILDAAAKEFGSRPVIVMESTAHYHRIIAQYFTGIGYEVLVINPMQSGALKNMNIRKVKSDKSDAHRIALLYRLKNLRTANQAGELLSNIRDLFRQRADIMSNHTAYVNRLTSLLDQAFPGYSKIFNRVASKSSLAVLKAFPTPDILLDAEPDQLAELIAAASRRGAGTDYVMAKVSDLFNAASYAAQFNIKRDAYRILICTVADILENLQLHIKTLEKQIITLAKESQEIYCEIQLLDSIPGIGLFSAAALRSEIGDFTLFKKPKQLVAFFGLDPSTRQSGKFVGTKTRLSKRGSPYARGLLDICAQTAVHPMKGKLPANPVLAAYYTEKIKTKAPKVVKCAIMRKMVEIIFAVLRDRQPFILRTPQEHIQMLRARNSALVAA